MNTGAQRITRYRKVRNWVTRVSIVDNSASAFSPELLNFVKQWEYINERKIITRV